MKVYIVRHGETIYNALNQYSDEKIDLNEKGILQAQELREKIKEINYDVIIASPLIRTQHTAKIINIAKKEIIIDERLKERNTGDLAGKPYTVTNREEYWNYNSTIQYGTSENIKDFFRRVYDFLDELKKKDYSRVLVVAHSGVSKAFSAYFEGMQDGKFLNRELKNCKIKEYEL